MTEFKDYKIHIVDANNYPEQYVASIEEFQNVIAIISTKDKAETALRSLFNKDIKRIKDAKETIHLPYSGKAKYSFASDGKIKAFQNDGELVFVFLPGLNNPH